MLSNCGCCVEQVWVAVLLERLLAWYNAWLPAYAETGKTAEIPVQLHTLLDVNNCCYQDKLCTHCQEDGNALALIAHWHASFLVLVQHGLRAMASDLRVQT